MLLKYSDEIDELLPMNKQVNTNVPAKESSSIEKKTFFLLQTAPLGRFKGLPSDKLVHYTTNPLKP